MQECTCFHDSDGFQGNYKKLDHNHPLLDLIYTLLWTRVTKEPISNWARISQEPSVVTSSDWATNCKSSNSFKDALMQQRIKSTSPGDSYVEQPAVQHKLR